MAENILAKMAVELSANTAAFNKGIAQSEKLLGSLEKTVKGTANSLKGAFAALGIAAIGKEIIDVTSEFQKFAAVLTNTLGSRSAANIAMRDIEKFASQTPFAVDELTASFVKLANQGFTPTTDELRKLGDLASSTGKGFDQLTEAIIDAQTGEFERLKEFGIRAKKEGDKVTFTFKGVQTQTEFTSKAIRDYVLSLGDAEGVSGAMAAISETLGGQISNLGDSWTTFLKTIGDGNKGPLSGAVSLLNETVKAATLLFRTTEQIAEGMKTDAQSNILAELKDLVSITGDMDAATAKLTARINQEREALEDELKAFEPRTNLFGVIIEQDEDHINMLKAKIGALNGEVQAIDDYTKAQIAANVAQDEANKKLTASSGIILDIEKKLKKLEEQRKASFSTAEITSFNVQIEKLKEELDLLNASRPLSNFGKRIFADAEAGLQSDLNIKLKDANIDTSSMTDPFLKAFDITDRFEESLQVFQKGFAIIQQGYTDTGIIAYNSSEQQALAWDMQMHKQQQAIALADEYGSTFGRIVGEAISGQESLVDTMKRITKELLATFLARAVGAAISSSFSSSGNPVIGAALAAASSALIVGMFSKIGGGGGGKGAGGGSLAKPSTATSPERMDRQLGTTQIVLTGEFKMRGKDLALAIDKERTTQQRTG